MGHRRTLLCIENVFHIIIKFCFLLDFYTLNEPTQNRTGPHQIIWRFSTKQYGILSTSIILIFFFFLSYIAFHYVYIKKLFGVPRLPSRYGFSTVIVMTQFQTLTGELPQPQAGPKKARITSTPLFWHNFVSFNFWGFLGLHLQHL